MKGFTRSNQRLSLCGLNCSLCPMYLANHCGGCGKGNQSCKIARCSIEHNHVEYCYNCKNYACEKYKDIDKYDSFISHYNQKVDLEKAKLIGIEKYNLEQIEKSKILNDLLSNYNDGRKKTFYCVAVNLLELSELRELVMQIPLSEENQLFDHKSQCEYVYNLFLSKSKELGINFKLRRKS